MADEFDGVLGTREAEQLATGFEFTEGPLWHPDGYWLFVDIRRSLIHWLAPGGEVEVYRDNSGGSNGLTFDLEGRLLMCEGRNRCVTRREPDGSIVAVAADWDGKRLNSPNDIVCRSDGAIYFTDPAFRLDAAERDIDFNGVFRVTADGAATPIIAELELPNGLALSPDESILYVANSGQHMHIAAYDVAADGSVSGGRVFADLSAGVGEGVPDGMKVDVEGRVYCTGPGGCWVWDAEGRYLGTIEVPEIPANMAWGGPDYRTMLFTARTSVYSMRMEVEGTRPPRAE